MGLSSKQVSSDVQDWNQGLLQSDDHTNSETSMELPMKRKQQQQQQQSPEKLKCPRCDSSNTKFCYYNNYNKSQPRYFCKACKRHWTKGGMLRNVPIGGGRKNKRLKTSTPAATKAAAATHVEMRPQSLVQDTVEFSIDSKSSNNGVFGGSSSLPYTQNHDLGFPYLSFGSLNESFPTTIPSSTYIEDLYDGSLSSSPLNEQPWISSESRSNCNWGWEDIDKFVISDVAVPWDDAEIN